MFSNYSHDHIALDTMNIMANGQYIDRIMTKIQNLTSRQATLSVNSASFNPKIDKYLPAYFYSQVNRFLLFYHFNFNFRCFSIYSDEIDIRNRIYSSRSIEWCNRNLERTSKTFCLNNFSIVRKHILIFISFWYFVGLSFKSNAIII